jgi:hypothetical protein
MAETPQTFLACVLSFHHISRAAACLGRCGDIRKRRSQGSHLDMCRIINLYQSLMGKKITMATTGSVFPDFIAGHMLGNLGFSRPGEI